MKKGSLSFAEKMLFLVCCLSVGVTTYTNTALMTAIPILVKNFSLTPTLAQWTIDLFLVLSVSFIILAGKLSEKFGIIKFYVFGLILFCVGSLIVGLANNVETILIGRALEGIGFGFIMPLSLQLLKQGLPESFHNTATAVWAGVLSLGFGIGPMIGGVFVSFSSWRYIFMVSAVAMLLAIVCILISLPGLHLSKQNHGAKKFHFFGFVSFTIAAISLVYFLIEVQQKGIANLFVDAVLVIAIVFFYVFYIFSKNHPSPYINIFFFKKRETFLSITGIFITMFALFQILYFYDAYLQNYYSMNLSPILAGSSLLLVSVLIFVISLFISKLSSVISERRLKIMGMMFTTLGFLCLFLFSEIHGFLFAQLICLVLLGVGMGISYPLFPGFGMRAVVAEHVSSLSAVISVASGLGCAVGVAVGGIIYKLYFQASLHIGEKILGIADQLHKQYFHEASRAVTVQQAMSPLAKIPKESTIVIQYAVGSGFSHVMLLCAFITIMRALIGTFWRSPDNKA